ncbi:hypothetical protein SAMN06893096_11339 [Geodermatophilus pulveris]|uniref:Uncharacterized protein n=1 Tax=Geodermatophilus pulveris TaxID=1564159 RepID=A0A239J801_9ACTN|nr:hypothetical protein SAMN06893096_11339 [Geodermatophilus pulveris]
MVQEVVDALDDAVVGSRGDAGGSRAEGGRGVCELDGEHGVAVLTLPRGTASGVAEADG